MESNSFDNRVHCYNIEILNIFDPELQLLNPKPMIKYKLKEWLSELKKLKFQSILVLKYMKGNDCEILHSSVELTASNSDIDRAFKSMHQSIMAKIKNSAYTDLNAETTVKHRITIFWC